MKLLRVTSAALVCIAIPGLLHPRRAAQAAEAPVTWSGQIAPIVYHNCTTCHHPGGGGPFSLITYQEAWRRGPQMVQVTQSRFMPPWLPAPGYGDFADTRRLTDEQVELIRKWVDAGMPEGDRTQAPPPPHYDATWQMGKPDLILTVERPYTLAASGTDVFRNFILPYPLAQSHFIRAMEILPTVPSIVHHCNVLIDRTASFRRLHPNDWKEGIPGMELEVDAGNTFDPDSHFLFWKPDTPVLAERAGMPWRLDPGNDLILNMHLKPSGKPEIVSAQIGLYFTSEAATLHPMLLQLEDDRDLDIPPGDRDFVVQDELRLPVDVEVLGVYPHAHYLGRELEGWAILPGGEKKWLIRIPNWDIDRQSIYRYREPIYLPRGSVLHMHYVYDNSTDNVHNPNDPPIRVRAGNRSVDEMAHLWIQVLPVNVPKGSPDPRLVLEQAWMEHRLSRNPADTIALYNLASAQAGLGQYSEAAAAYRKLLVAHPDDARTLNSLGAALENAGDLQGAGDCFEHAIALAPGACDARFNLAGLDLKRSQLSQAEEEFRAMLRQCPADAGGHSGLGVALSGEGNAAAAEAEFQRALELDPKNFSALYHLGRMAIEAGQPQRAADLLEAAVSQRPDDLDTRENLAMAFAQSGRPDDALAQLREAERLAPDNAELHALLSQVLAGTGQLQQAIDEQNAALHLEPKDADGWNNLGVLEARMGKAIAARYDFQRALQLSPDHAQARANLARLPRQ
ncbi:MAG TPA: tetratricopeptide repeat protein [Terracidiphilus sp.]|nr:tetratricopeptide repeat protein [Terracidiphilus sp.]